MKLIFIRHSQSLVNRDVPIDSWGLSDEGVSLAKKLQENPNVQKIQVIYTSLQPKALETAILSTKNKGVYLKTDDRLTEITSFTKKFEELPVLEEKTKAFYEGKIDRLNGGETKEEALQRFTQAIEEVILKEAEKEYVGIVSHGAILAFFFAQFTKESPLDLLHKMQQPDIAVLDWETKKIIQEFGQTL